MSKGLNIIDGKVYDPKRGTLEQLNIAIQGDTVIGLGFLPDDKDDDFDVIDAKGCIIVPNITDALVHKGTHGIDSIQQAAQQAGITRFALAPQGNSYAEKDISGMVPLGPLTQGGQGTDMADVGLMRETGITACYDQHPIDDAVLMHAILRYSAMFDVRVMVNPLDTTLAQEGVMHEGPTSMVMGLKGIPSVAESIRVSRDLQLLESTGGKLHISLLSTKAAVDLVRQAKAKKLDVTCSVAIHQLCLTDEDVQGYNTACRVMPPLRSEADRKALVDGIADGTIDCVVSDSCSLGVDDKRADFSSATPGISGLASFIPLTLTTLVDKEGLTLEHVLRTLSWNTRQVLGNSPKGIALTNKASFTVIDPKAKKDLTVDDFALQPVSSPFIGESLAYWPKVVVQDGKVVYQATS